MHDKPMPHTSGFKVTVTVFTILIMFLLALLQNYALFELPKAYNEGYDQCKAEYRIYLNTLKEGGMLLSEMPPPSLPPLVFGKKANRTG